ncbi:Rft-1-domain-containing protein [Microstroma glucosiphilum]|uniref:Man(5)GlcNAc(2)-PP-dolichol translocation protein RFT1 n=1 Tax=Pseudomicrostroma glucosiphilum TaxID=1684307 RepID=A0A316U721_9BASI|nr:Rft-1-domain-containing protein [Pseudomicrostroma glucosiphilum]PWN21039.1 Rft-1-domain-containing protein [Pseudomicrostroma glucosiphilum]
MGRFSSLSPAILLLSLQILTRVFTFGLNQLLIRFSSPALYGAAHIRCELVLGIVLFLSREGIRAATLRQDDRSEIQAEGKDRKSKHGVDQEAGSEGGNLSLLPIPLGILFALLALPLFTSSSTESQETRPYQDTVIHLYLLSALLELLSEPLYLHALSARGGRNLALRVRAEGSAAIAKGVVTLAGVFSLGEEAGLLAFGLGQAAYGAAILLTFTGSYSLRFGLGRTLHLYMPNWSSPAKPKDESRTSTDRLAVLLFLQSILKHLLTEADKIAVSRLASLEDQGGYALGTNYASLPLRLVFQPLEESSRFQFCQTLGSLSDDRADGANTTASTKETQVGKVTSEPATQSRAKAKHLLTSLLHLHLFLGLFLLSYLPPLSRPFIQALSGSQWASTSAPRTLSAFALFLPVAGWSGILEGFLQSTASPTELKRYNRVILSSSATFGVVLWTLTRERVAREVGVSTEEALLYASTASMAVRALFGWRYAVGFFKRSQELALTDLLPSRATVLTTAASAGLLRAVASRLPFSEDPMAVLPLKAYGPVVLAALSTGVGALGIMWSQDRQSIMHALSALHG